MRATITSALPVSARVEFGGDPRGAIVKIAIGNVTLYPDA